MKMYDCDICLSAGSVNQWGYCEICGEEYEDPGSLVDWDSLTKPAAVASGEGEQFTGETCELVESKGAAQETCFSS